MLGDEALIDAIRPSLPFHVDTAQRWGSNPAHRVFRLVTNDSGYFLKVAPDVHNERARLDWLPTRLNAPCVVAFGSVADESWLAMTEVRGDALTAPRFRDDPHEVAGLIAQAIREVHAVDASGCPFGKPAPGHVLVHGDACLPNILVTEEMHFGFVDLADLEVASPEVDLSAAVWSLQYNHGPGFGRLFLERYGWQTTSDEEVARLHRLYVSG